MKCKPLKDVAQIIMGQSPDSSSYNEVGEGLPFFQGNADFGVMYPSERIWCNQPKKIANENDILISVRAPIGALNYANKKCCIGRGLAAITVNNPVERNYIFHLLKAKNAELNRKGTGSTFKAIGKNVLEDIPVPIVSSEIQLHITRLMDITESIISKRKNELKYYDELIKARFVEMFWDPISNPKKWKVVKIGDIVKDVRYGTSRPAVEGGKYPYLRMNNLTVDGQIDLTDLKYIDIPESEIEKCIVRKGDVLFNRTNSVELVGKTALFNLPDEMVIAGYIIRLRLNKDLRPEILSQYLNLKPLKDILRSMAKGAVNQANINAKELQNIRVYLPEMELQNAFVVFAHQIDKSKVAVQKSLNQAQLLFDSLMQQYFG